VRTLATLILTGSIVLVAMLTMSMAFVVVCGVAGIVVYAMTDRLEVGLAAGLVVGLLGWLGVHLIADFLLVVVPTSPKRRG